MAKVHMQYLARELAKKFEETDKIMSDAGLALSDTVLSPEEQKEFSKHKSEVDSNLGMLSVALSAGAQGKLPLLMQQVISEKEAILEPLQKLSKDLSDEKMPDDIRETTEQLVRQYIARLITVNETLSTLILVEFFANYPKSKKRQRKYVDTQVRTCHFYVNRTELVGLTTRGLLDYFYDKCSPFAALDLSIEEFQNYVKQLGTVAVTPTEVDDLSE